MDTPTDDQTTQPMPPADVPAGDDAATGDAAAAPEAPAEGDEHTENPAV